MAELQDSSDWNQFLETRGGLRAIERILAWHEELLEDIREHRNGVKGNEDG